MLICLWGIEIFIYLYLRGCIVAYLEVADDRLCGIINHQVMWWSVLISLWGIEMSMIILPLKRGCIVAYLEVALWLI